MQNVQMASFAMIDANLYLDTHPCDTVALSAFNEYRSRYQWACEQYSEKCGPLTINTAGTGDKWDWVDGPWPWQL